MKKKAIALLITLSSIILITSIIYDSFSITSKLMDVGLKNRVSYIQTNQLSYDIVRNLNTYIKNRDIKGAKDLHDNFYDKPIRFTISDDISFNVVCTSASKSFNPNALYFDSDKDDNVSVVQKVLSNYEKVKYPYVLADMIADAIDLDKEQRRFNSEISLTNGFFRDGGIENYKHFDSIIKHYVEQTSDEEILQLDFAKIFSFYSYFDGNNSIKIDFNYADNDIISSLSSGYDFGYSLTKDDVKKIKEDSDNFKESLSGIENLSADFISVGLKLAKCSSVINMRNENIVLTFIYDIDKKKASDFEF